MVRKTLYIILLILLIIDLGYSFKQHSSQPLDGDMAGGIVPANDVKNIFKSPLGLDALLGNKIYPNPNRFFSHWIFKEYFNIVPIWLQKYTNPIDSVYLTCAIAKITIQFLIIFFLSIAITGKKNIFKLELIVAMILITPFFQTNGYRGYMGIIDPSTTYTFFYALPSALLLLYLIPFIKELYHSQQSSINFFTIIIWLPLSAIVCLSGPLNPGIVLIFSVLVLLNNLKNNYTQSTQNKTIKKTIDSVKAIPKSFMFFLIPIVIFSTYSLYIGKYNSINIVNQVPLSELYLKLPEGIYYQFTQKLGFPVLFAILTLNTIIIKKYFKTSEGVKLLNVFKWIGIFSLLYILLLPLGGYRVYRPYILRYDTIMPITISLIFIFGATTLYLFKQMKIRHKIWYIPLIICILFIFTNADKPEFDKNQCEKIALKEISESKEKIVELKNNCSVLSWDKITKPEDSELNAQLLLLWNITNEKRLYYTK